MRKQTKGVRTAFLDGSAWRTEKKYSVGPVCRNMWERPNGRRIRHFVEPGRPSAQTSRPKRA